MKEMDNIKKEADELFLFSLQQWIQLWVFIGKYQLLVFIQYRMIFNVKATAQKENIEENPHL